MRATCIRITVLLPILGLFTSCGGSQNPGAGTTTPAVALGTLSFNVPAGDGTALSIDVPKAGALAASATWSEAHAEIDVYITDASCGSLDDLVLGSCKVLGQGALGNSTRQSNVQTATALGVQAGRYQAFVLGVGPSGSAGSVAFTLSQ